jgi:hypothetical protein
MMARQSVCLRQSGSFKRRQRPKRTDARRFRAHLKERTMSKRYYPPGLVIARILAVPWPG